MGGEWIKKLHTRKTGLAVSRWRHNCEKKDCMSNHLSLTSVWSLCIPIYSLFWWIEKLSRTFVYTVFFVGKFFSEFFWQIFRADIFDLDCKTDLDIYTFLCLSLLICVLSMLLRVTSLISKMTSFCSKSTAFWNLLYSRCHYVLPTSGAPLKRYTHGSEWFDSQVQVKVSFLPHLSAKFPNKFSQNKTSN